jgi:carbon-monoxide dehydrogenase medium subunit
VEEALAGQVLSTETIDAAAKLAGSDVKAINGDIHASAEYRRAMIPVFTRRALNGALARV